MRIHALIAAALLVACGGDDDVRTVDANAAAEQSTAGSATALASSFEQPSSEELEAGRLDPSWRQWAEQDVRERQERAGSPARSTSTGASAAAEGGSRAGGTGTTDSLASPGSRSAETGAADSGSADQGQSASWDDISPRTVNAPARGLPLSVDVAGPTVARVQILLDRVQFRPGIIDGRWGKNTEKAVYWFQNARGIEATGTVDRATLDRLEQEAGIGSGLVVEHTLTQADVEGPFVELPEDVYERAEMDCLCYESLSEKLTEVFHTAPELLEKLNPGVDLDAVSAGDVLQVPNVETFHVDGLPEGKYTGGGQVARVVISDGGHYLHGLAEDGSILYHFPTTLGSDYAPSPSGEFSVTSITFDPTWHYQPDLLTGVDPSREDAVLPAGPNNAVGVVWMQLSKDHYGIHGTSAPATIGYVTSHGCVRLTNWDAGLLGQNLPAGTPLEFRDVTGR